jgi:uncharacterized membrane protein
MNLYYFSMVLVVICNVAYHLSQKAMPEGINPVVALIATYGTALVFSGLLLFVYPSKTSLIESFKQVNWASYVLGFAVVGLEVGFLLAYRAGWNVSTAALYSQVIVALLLIPVGIFVFKDVISLKNAFGIILSIIGVALMSVK